MYVSSIYTDICIVWEKKPFSNFKSHEDFRLLVNWDNRCARSNLFVKKTLELYVFNLKIKYFFFLKKKTLYITCNGIQTAKKQVNCIIYQEIYLMRIYIRRFIMFLGLHIIIIG